MVNFPIQYIVINLYFCENFIQNIESYNTALTRGSVNLKGDANFYRRKIEQFHKGSHKQFCRR